MTNNESFSGPEIPLPSNDVLHQQIIDPVLLPPPELQPGQVPYMLGVLGVRDVLVGNEPVALRSPSDVFIFNRLMLARGIARDPLLLSEGYRGPATRFRPKIDSVINDINTAAGEELIIRTGSLRTLRYMLARHVGLFSCIDRQYRQEPLPLMPATESNPQLEERRRIAIQKEKEELAAPSRLAVLRNIIAAYGGSDAVRLRLARHRSNGAAGPSPTNNSLDAIMWNARLYPDAPKIEVQDQHLQSIAKGYEVYDAARGDLHNLTPAQHEALNSFAVAYEILYVGAISPLLVKQAYRLARQHGVPAEDLLQVGIQGMTNAIAHYDSSFENTFATYAMGCTVGLMQRAATQLSRTIRLGESAHIKYMALVRAQRRLEAVAGDTPPIEEIIAEASQAAEKPFTIAPQDAVHLLQMGRQYLTPFDTPGNDEDARTLGDTIPDPDNNIDAFWTSQELRLTAARLFEEIDSRWPDAATRMKAVVALSHGLLLDGFKDITIGTPKGTFTLHELVVEAREQYGTPYLTRPQISELLGIGQAAVSNLHVTALKRMRAKHEA